MAIMALLVALVSVARHKRVARPIPPSMHRPRSRTSR